MSGHSKWSTIKRKKGAADAKRGAIFTRLSREIVMAAREGGGDPDSNFRLRLAVDKARAENMPKDNIERAIRRGSGEDKDAAAFEQIMYEGYAPHGVAVMVETVTDNRNRTVADLRHTFSKAVGNMIGLLISLSPPALWISIKPSNSGWKLVQMTSSKTTEALKSRVRWNHS